MKNETTIEYVEKHNELFLIQKTKKHDDATLYLKFYPYKKTVEIESLVVWNENMRGKGIGRKLIQEAIAYLKDKPYDRLIVKSDPSAVGFYTKMGFSKIDNNTEMYGFNSKG